MIIKLREIRTSNPKCPKVKVEGYYYLFVLLATYAPANVYLWFSGLQNAYRTVNNIVIIKNLLFQYITRRS